MQRLDEMLILVQRECNGWRTAGVRVGDLEAIHWLQPNEAPVPLVHAYVACTSFVKGNIPHDCERTPVPHRLIVCAFKRHIAPAAHAELAQRATEHRQTEARRRSLISTKLTEPTSYSTNESINLRTRSLFKPSLLALTFAIAALVVGITFVSRCGGQ